MDPGGARAYDLHTIQLHKIKTHIDDVSLAAFTVADFRALMRLASGSATHEDITQLEKYLTEIKK